MNSLHFWIKFHTIVSRAESGSMLSGLHLYPKTPQDLLVKTKAGGLVSLVAVLIMSLLFLTELSAYLSSRFETALSLDDNNDQLLLIEIHVDLPRVPCHVLDVEVSDVFGTRKVSSDSNIFKHQLSLWSHHELAMMRYGTS